MKYLSANGMQPGAVLRVAYGESDLIDNSNYGDIRNMVGDNLQKARALSLEQNPETPREKILYEAFRLHVDTKQRKIK